MNCDICARSHALDLPFYCVACARGLLYPTRLDAIALLLEKEQLAHQVEDVIRYKSLPNVDSEHHLAAKSNGHGLSRTWAIDHLRHEIEKSKCRQVVAQSALEKLHEEVEQIRREVAAKKAEINERRTILNTITALVPQRRQDRLSKLAEVSVKGSHSFDSLHRKTVDAKVSLCREAALLLRLRHRKKRREGIVQDFFSISGLPIHDLKDISSLTAAEVSAVLSSIVHLICLVTFYLGVRLPAELSTGNRTYPLSTISLPAGSYITRKVDYSTLFSASPLDSSNVPTYATKPLRPRPLFINTEDPEAPVARVARKDPAAFNLFLEGVSLLAWDLAWLCRSQGLEAGTETWEEVCDIGRNLWQLLLSPPQSAALMRVLSGRDIQNRQRSDQGIKNPVQEASRPEMKLGAQSHASAYSFLGAPNTIDPLRGWKLTKHTMIMDSLKKTLFAEISNAEWELLGEKEWDDGGEQFDEAVFVQTRAAGGRDIDDARSIMTTRERHDTAANHIQDTGKAKGTSGWTKVKSRER